MESTKIQQEVNPIKVIPGRGLVTHMGTQMRKDYLNQLGYSISNLETTTLKLVEIQKNIESYIGTVEVPVGVVGPLIWNKENNENTGNHDNSETVFAPIGTLEGALVASMNRGARAISLSGGFQSEVKWQRMSRAPMFEFENSAQTQLFVEFIENYFTRIKQKAESYSNHANLEKIDIIREDVRVHTVFFYQTGDASGQNMTTTCTWHAMLFIIDEFYTLHGIECVNYILEGNGSSDKKISEYNRIHGRGIHVEATALIQEKYIREVLRTTSQKMLHVFGPSKALAQKNGMVGYSINAANAVASIFVATGQDLACIHESSVAFLDLLPHNDGMLAKITFTNLVVGTVGGGTHLPKQSEALELMGCKGNGKSSRFASLIAGFALGLELSTYAAIVSGEFAKAHEKLGRNRPVEWLTRNEVNKSFLLSFLKHPQKEKIMEIVMEDAPCTEDGILTHIAARATKKLIGFEEVVLKFETSIPHTISGLPPKEGSSKAFKVERILLKSKATDTEVIKGLHLISASIDSMLSDLISQHRETLEYKNSHLKEGVIYEYLDANAYPFIPNFYGSYRNDEREAHILCLEFLQEKDMFIFNSENHPEHWNRNAIQWAISDIGVAHRLLKQIQNTSTSNLDIIQEFKPWENNQLYNQIIHILQQQNDESLKTIQLERFVDAGKQLETMSNQLSMIPKTVIHNDFNSRNVAVRLNGDVVVYDWELSVIGFPHRDVVELLSFTLDLKKNIPDWLSYLEFHFQDSKQLWANLEADEFLEFRKQWFFTYEYALIELIATRLIFYEVAGIVVKYEFSNRVLQTAVWILDQVQEYNRQFKK
jgi:hydroxymethylglutaryl-CoA reductase (NADPH)